MPAGGQQNAREQTLARPPSSSKATPDLPPGFAASSTHSTANAQSGHLMSRSSASPSGIVRPSVPTLAPGALLGADPQGAVPQQADTPVSASAADQSAYQQRRPGFGPSRPQRTPTQDPGRRPSPQAADRPPGFSIVPLPQSLESPQLGGSPPIPSSSSSPAYMSTQMQSQHDFPQSHQARRSCARFGCASCYCLRSNTRSRASDWTHELAVTCDVLECTTFHNLLLQAQW